MKSLIIGSIALALVSVSGLNAQIKPAQAVNLTVSQFDKTPVKPEDLPAPIKTVLASEAFKGWEVTTAYLVSEDGTEYYEVNLTKGPDRQTVKFDKNGKILNP
ncbi:hypothetical protein GVN16_11500 [Emticicia sp. CRIBPO]|uniref:hypothetical protein n=1 Tax=Emticicia sp. CRIBPO TaxID=2683258 RepID=UPI001412929B|nr:hypothetical protein [Emticicia sp. CRIBPO]NBA86393.1 hypothetical protein [Emticicia sp. CRIBPO]